MNSKYHRHSPGYALKVGDSPFKHHFGGAHSIKGADCPNCAKPLVQHFVIDCHDERLGLQGLDIPYLPLLYCMRCELSWYDFIYDVISPTSISVVKAYTDKTGNRASVLEEWNEEVGLDEFPERPADLFKVPSSIETLFNKFNEGDDHLTDEEEDQVGAFNTEYLDLKGENYAAVDAINQIGGRSLLYQPLEDPICGKCEEPMPFIASFTNESIWDLKLSFDSVQIVFFLCSKCRRIHVQHSI